MRFQPRLWNDPALGFILLAAGLALIAIIGRLEERERRTLPWTDAIWAIDKQPPWTGTIALAARRIPVENFPETAAALEELRKRAPEEQVEMLGLERTEWLIALAVSPETLEPILESGRLPSPGTNEVLAGVYARLDHFEVDGKPYEVVGRLKRGVGGLYFSYVQPTSSPLEWEYPETEGWARGWLDPSGTSKLADSNYDPQNAAYIGANAPAQRSHAMGLTAGLACVLIGGAIIQLRVLFVFASRKCGPLRPILAAMIFAPGRLLFVHFLLYGSFVGAMIAADFFPVESMRIQDAVISLFAKGNLAYIREAYDSANIPRAALMTFFNNYVLQTLVYTLAISLVIPFAGVLKSIVSFSLAGFVLTPMWAGYSGGLLYHSITVTLELEAYVIAAFSIVIFAFKIAEGLREKRLRTELLAGLAIVFSAALLTGIMLAVAALYEATTLILLA